LGKKERREIWKEGEKKNWERKREGKYGHKERKSDLTCVVDLWCGVVC
jgi:hypothetical protein